MNVATRLLELEGVGMDPLQVLFARQVLTMIFCCIWMWWKNIPDFPFGAKGIQGLLLCRGLTGFLGIYGIYCKLMFSLYLLKIEIRASTHEDFFLCIQMSFVRSK